MKKRKVAISIISILILTLLFCWCLLPTLIFRYGFVKNLKGESKFTDKTRSESVTLSEEEWECLFDENEIHFLIPAIVSFHNKRPDFYVETEKMLLGVYGPKNISLNGIQLEIPIPSDGDVSSLYDYYDRLVENGRIGSDLDIWIRSVRSEHPEWSEMEINKIKCDVEWIYKLMLIPYDDFANIAEIDLTNKSVPVYTIRQNGNSMKISVEKTFEADGVLRIHTRSDGESIIYELDENGQLYENGKVSNKATYLGWD